MTTRRLTHREIPLAVVPGESTYGLKVYRDVYEVDGVEEPPHWQYDLPDGVVVFALTPNNEVVAIERWRPGVGEYPQIPAENLKSREISSLRDALRKKDAAAVESVVVSAARRCLSEETGYEAGVVQLLTVLSQHSGKTPQVHCFCLALDCVKVQVEGSGQKKEGIKLLPLTDVASMWEKLMAYLEDQPTEPHGGKNSITAMTLALRRLGMLKVSIPR